MRWMGLLFILLSCSGTGFWYANQYEKRMIQIQDGILVLQRWKREMQTASSLEESAEILKNHSGQPYQNFFQKLQTEIAKQQGDRLEKIWRTCTDTMRGSALSARELQSWMELGKQLDSMDLQVQQTYLEQMIEQWKADKENLKMEWGKKRHLYQSLGVLGGITICILLM